LTKIEERAASEPNLVGTVLLHNVMDADGKRLARKGMHLTAQDVALLRESGIATVEVIVLEADDVPEDEAALVLAQSLMTDETEPTRPAGGRVNLRSRVDALLVVDETRLRELNSVPGIALATRRQHVVVGPRQETDNVATLKIVPFVLSREHLDRAIEIVQREPRLLQLQPFPPEGRVAMLFVADESVHDRLRTDYLPPTEERLARLGASIVATENVLMDEAEVTEAVERLARDIDLLIVASQTSVAHEEDTIPRALRRAGADEVIVGAPVEPGNLVALAYLPGTPVMVAPGCAKGRKRNVVDLVLPRLLIGERLGRADVAGMGLGGFLTPAERGGDIT
jgi:molybdenum cofactor cytidylyltransferase